MDIINKIELDLIRAKETGNVSYDIKSSLNEPGYAPAIEAILQEIQSPQTIPVEIKEGVGAISAKIQEEEQKKIREKGEQEAQRIKQQREEFEKLAEEEQKKIKKFRKEFKKVTDKLQTPMHFDFEPYNKMGDDMIKKGQDSAEIIPLLGIQIGNLFLNKMDELEKRARQAGLLSLAQTISGYYDTTEVTEDNYTEVIDNYDKYNKEINDTEKNITAK